MRQMCGRFTLGNPDQLPLRFDVAPERAPLQARYNIAPSQLVPVIVEGPRGRAVQQMQWGFQPPWVTDETRRPAPINARAETLLERPLFRGAVVRRRCLIPADGFFEWQAVPDRRGKQPMYIRLRDGGLFAFAGLYAERPGPDGTATASCAVITTAPNRLMEPIHNRMPAILDPADEALWLDPGVTTPEVALHCLRPYPDDALVAYPVASAVSNPRYDGADLIVPLQDATAYRGVAV